MAKLWKRTRGTDGKAQNLEIDLTTFTVTSPTIIYISGFLTTDDAPGMIGGGIKKIEELLQGHPELPSLPNTYTWSHTNLKSIFNLAAYNLNPETKTGPDAELFAQKIILPLVAANGQPLPLAAAQKNLRNLTLFGYSAGTVVAQQIFNASVSQMQKNGYTAEGARALLQEIVLVSTGNMSRPTQEKNRFTTLYLAASNDLAVRWKNRLWTPLRNIFKKYAKELTIRPLSDTSLLITAAVKKKFWEWGKTPAGKQEKKKIDPLLPRWTSIRSYHELPHYITADDEHSQFSKIVLHALVNACNRQKKMAPLELLAPVTSHKPEEIKAYNERIQKAVVKKK